MSHSSLSTAQNKILDDQIDAGIPSVNFPNRQTAVLQILRYTEYEYLSVSKAGSESSRNADISLLMDAADCCIQWCQTLAETDEAVPDALTQNDVAECKRIFAIALDYMGMCELVTISFQNLLDAQIIGPDQYSFLPKTSLATVLEVADWLLKDLNVPPKADQVSSPDYRRVDRNIDRSKALDQWLLRSLKMKTFRYIYDWCLKVYSRDWELPGVMEIDGFTLQEVRHFFCGLRALGMLCMNISLSSAPTGLIQPASTVPVFTKKEIISYLKPMTGMSTRLLNMLVEYFTYDVNLSRQPHSVLQPIMPIGKDLFAFAPVFVVQSDVERNVFDLVNIKNKPRYDNHLKAAKEDEWTSRLKTEFEARNLLVKTNFNYPGANGPTEIDLVVIDLEKQIGLLIELKWLLGGKFINDGHRKYLAKGFGQAENACRWASNDIPALESKLNLPPDTLSGVALHPLLISKTGLMNGHVQHPTVPIICGRLLDWLLHKANADLSTIWHVASTKSYLPTKDLHFKTTTRTIKFNGLEFTQQKILEGRKSWNAQTDINLRP